LYSNVLAQIGKQVCFWG